MKKIDEINWSLEFIGKEEEEYELSQFAQGIALCNGDYVPQDFIDFYNDLQVQVWEGKITEKQMDDFLHRSLEE